MYIAFCTYCHSDELHRTVVEGDAEVKQCCICGHIDVMAHVPEVDDSEVEKAINKALVTR